MSAKDYKILSAMNQTQQRVAWNSLVTQPGTLLTKTGNFVTKADGDELVLWIAMHAQQFPNDNQTTIQEKVFFRPTTYVDQYLMNVKTGETASITNVWVLYNIYTDPVTGEQQVDISTTGDKIEIVDIITDTVVAVQFVPQWWASWAQWNQWPQWVAWAQWPQGAQGTAWSTWPQGAQGTAWWSVARKWPWDSWTAYIINDWVSIDGSSYICILWNTNQTPPNGTYWQLIAQAWSQWAQGSQGSTGAQGSQWAQWTTWSQGATGAQWNTWAQWPQGTTWSQWATWAQGATGSQWATWAQGATGTQWAQGNQGAQWAQWSQGTQGTQWSQWAQWEAWWWSSWINIRYSLTWTYASTSTFTFSWDAWDAEAIERSLFTCLSSADARKIGYVKSASHSAWTVTVTVVTDIDLASWDKTFKVAINRKVEDYQHLFTIPWEQIADASNPQGMFYRSLIDTYLLPVNSFVRTASAWSGAACAWNVYKWTTNLFTSAQDMTTSSTFDEKRPNTNTISAWDIVTLRVTSSAWATNKASDLQVQAFIVPQTLYTTAD